MDKPAVYNESRLPKFDVGINADVDFELLHHNHSPRFVARIDIMSDPPSMDKHIEWIDPIPNAEALRDLLRAAYDWFLDDERKIHD